MSEEKLIKRDITNRTQLLLGLPLLAIAFPVGYFLAMYTAKIEEVPYETLYERIMETSKEPTKEPEKPAVEGYNQALQDLRRFLTK